MSDPRIIVALDYADAAQALNFVSQVEPDACRVKVGKELFCRGGPALVERLVRRGFDVFLDLKFHDIPHTVAQACAAGADLGVWMMNVHALGGRTMMQAARAALTGASAPLLIAVTVLTSHNEHDLHEIGLSGGATENVVRLATLAQQAGLDGVVCSPLETAALREMAGPAFKLVTPGVRPPGAGLDDQRRVLTPAQAMLGGASYLVIGRPITAAPDPRQALREIQAQIDAVV